MSKLPAPNDILELANHNPEVRNCLEYWRQGYCSWEQALMLAVVVLSTVNDDLSKSAIKVIEIRDHPTYG